MFAACISSHFISSKGLAFGLARPLTHIALDNGNVQLRTYRMGVLVDTFNVYNDWLSIYNQMAHDSSHYATGIFAGLDVPSYNNHSNPKDTPGLTPHKRSSPGGRPP